MKVGSMKYFRVYFYRKTPFFFAVLAHFDTFPGCWMVGWVGKLRIHHLSQAELQFNLRQEELGETMKQDASITLLCITLCYVLYDI